MATSPDIDWGEEEGGYGSQVLTAADVSDLIPEGSDLTFICTKYAEFYAKKKELEAELKEIKEKMLGIEKVGVDKMEATGCTSVVVFGKNVHLKRTIWAGVDKETVQGLDSEEYKKMACQALKDAGLEHFVFETFNTQTVSAWARKLEEDSEGMPSLPPELEGKIKCTEKYALGVRKAAKK